MGILGCKLFANDTTCDVRDSYVKYLEQQLSDMEAYKKTYEEYKELIGTDEEPLFWYALADTQWRLGRLLPEVKEIALTLIDAKAGTLLWDEDSKKVAQWENTLQVLKNKIESKMPPRKIIKKPIEFIRNPWDIGDVYAYEFHTQKAEKNGLLGKYILFQKVANVEYYGDYTFSVIQVFDQIFDSVPTLHQLNDDIRILPLCLPLSVYDNFTDKGAYIPSFECYQKATMIYEKKLHYPKKYMTFVGNQHIPEIEYTYNPYSEFYLAKDHMEDWLVDFYIAWKHVKY